MKFFNENGKGPKGTSGSVGLDRVSQASDSEKQVTELKLQAGAWAWTGCHRRPILFVFAKLKSQKLCHPIATSLCPACISSQTMSHNGGSTSNNRCFHRWHRIAGMFERLA